MLCFNYRYKRITFNGNQQVTKFWTPTTATKTNYFCDFKLNFTANQNGKSKKLEDTKKLYKMQFIMNGVYVNVFSSGYRYRIKQPTTSTKKRAWDLWHIRTLWASIAFKVIKLPILLPSLKLTVDSALSTSERFDIANQLRSNWKRATNAKLNELLYDIRSFFLRSYSTR